MAIKEFITKEDAVSYLLGMGEALDNFTVQELTEAVAEEADANAHNWVVDNPKKLEKGLLNGMANIADIRAGLVSHYQNLIEDMLVQAEIFQVNTKQVGDAYLIEYDSFAEWVGDYLYINLPLRKASTLLNAKWKDVTVKIKDSFKIQVKISGYKKASYMTFTDLGLIAQNKYDPNFVGGILIGLAQNERYPPANEPLENKHSVNITRLKRAIKELVPITDVSSPITYDDVRGYRTAFKLIDDRKSRENRAKKDAIHVEYNDELYSDDEYSFEDEDDLAGKFLRDNPV